MSSHAITWALKQKTECSGTKLLLIMLSNYADKQNECYPSIPHLSELCGCSKSSVARYTRKLVKQGLIKVKKVGVGMKKHNHYTLNVNTNENIKLNGNTNNNIKHQNRFIKQKTRNKNFIAG